ncbi:MAG TPA: alpha/beta fold hydrolase [Bacteroidales bacterium]|nr:alpha/beta fold hydrolase [Bacteroidales bacterium]
MKKVLLILSLIITVHISSAQSSRDLIKGSWIGKLTTGAIDLRIVFNITADEYDSLIVTLDSPDQGAEGIKVGPINITGRDFIIMAPTLRAEYQGSLVNDTTINGTFSQGGMALKLNLTRLTTEFSTRKPQEPVRPYPYKDEEVTFRNEKGKAILAGTLTIPQGNGPFPAVILITGSGAQNRNEELMGHKPFLVIADYLTRQGIAVLRYDDRGVGKSTGDIFTSTSLDFASDAEAALEFLKKDKRIKQGSIGMIGHSEGSMIAAIVASSRNDVDFIVSLSGAGLTGDIIIKNQAADLSRTSGVSGKKIKENEKVNSVLFSILKKEKDNNKASEKMVDAYIKMAGQLKLSPEEAEIGLQQVKSSVQPITLNWLRYFVSTNPADFWKKVKCPVLALNGSLDLQVAAGVNLKAIEKALKSGGNTNVKTIEMPGLNHLFQHCKTGLPAEYSTIDETFSPEALNIIAGWVKELR